MNIYMSKFITFCVIVVILCIIIVAFNPLSDDIFSIKEGIHPGGGGGGRGGRGGGRGGGGRRWYGGNYGYRYRPPPVRFYQQYYPRYLPLWSSAYWFGSICKDGCTNIGNNNWGCQFPGGGPNDCIFASDCYGCGY